MVSVITRNQSNPQGWNSWTDDSKTVNFEGLAVDLEGYGQTSFQGTNTPTAIVGAVRVPTEASIQRHGAGIGGYADNYSQHNSGGVAVFGMGRAFSSAALAWGVNSVSTDGTKANNFATTIWGYECDINVYNRGTTALGIDIVGGSLVPPNNNSTALHIQCIGVDSPDTGGRKIPWPKAIYLRDGASTEGIVVGTQTEDANASSQPITLVARNGNSRVETLRIQALGGANSVIDNIATNTLLKIRSNVNGAIQDNLTIFADRVGVGPVGIPQYTLDVAGAARFRTSVGFNGAAPVARQIITGRLSDFSALANLINALATAGLVQNQTTY